MYVRERRKNMLYTVSKNANNRKEQGLRAMQNPRFVVPSEYGCTEYRIVFLFRSE